MVKIEIIKCWLGKQSSFDLRGERFLELRIQWKREIRVNFIFKFYYRKKTRET